MTKKKNRFWTFVFSMLPGAAEMYMGFMKMGLSLMSLFFGVAMLAVFLEQGILIAVDAIVWFYSFFHAHNLRGMEDEDFYALEDEYLIHLDNAEGDFWTNLMKTRYRQLAAGVLILIGASILWTNLLSLFQWFFPDFVGEVMYRVGYRMPRIVLAVGIIVAGVWLIRGKKQELSEDVMEEPVYGGEEREKDA